MIIEDAKEAAYVVIEQPGLTHEPETVRYFLTHAAAELAYKNAGAGTMILEVITQK